MRPTLTTLRVKHLLLATTFTALLSAEEPSAIVANLTAHGDYERALKFAAGHIQQLKVTNATTRDTVYFFVYLGRAEVEVGLLKQADEAFHQAENVSEMDPTMWQALLLRERAALALTMHDYRKAEQLAARATELSRKAGYYNIRVAYCQSLLTTARIRLGDLPAAEAAIANAVKYAGKNPSKHRIFGPRSYYAASLVHSHRGEHEQARELCKRALTSIARPGKTTRDDTLGQLTLAEIELRAGDHNAARTAAQEALESTRRLFGDGHPDVVSALDILARIAHREGKADEALLQAQQAFASATRIFGKESPGAHEARQLLTELESAPR